MHEAEFMGSRDLRRILVSLAIPIVWIRIECEQWPISAATGRRDPEAASRRKLPVRRIEIAIAKKEAEHIRYARRQLHRKPMKKDAARIGDMGTFERISIRPVRQRLRIESTYDCARIVLKRHAKIRLGDDLMHHRIS